MMAKVIKYKNMRMSMHAQLIIQYWLKQLKKKILMDALN